MQKQPEMTLIQLLQYLDNNAPVSQSVDYEYDDTVYIDSDGYVYDGNDTAVIDRHQHNYSWAAYSLHYDNGIVISYIYDASVITDTDDHVIDTSIDEHPYTNQPYESHMYPGLCVEGVTLTDYDALDVTSGHDQYVWDWIAREFGRMQDADPAEAVRKHLESLHN